jgi:hypothetical protein
VPHRHRTPDATGGGAKRGVGVSFVVRLTFHPMPVTNGVMIAIKTLSCSLGLLFTVSLRAADAPATFKVSEFTFARPANWEWVESTSQMRKAQLKVVKNKAEAEVVFFHFGPGNAGGTQANVDRWYRQFEGSRENIGAKSEDVTVGKHKVTYVQAEGTYRSGIPGGPQTPMPGYALVGAIIEASEGNVFVKMTGPKALTKSATDDFKKMVEAALK